MPEEPEKAVGGTFTLNYYWQHEYEEAGIKAVTHFIEKDEFWRNGANIGEKGVNPVVFFTAVKGYAPGSPEESMPFRNENHKKKFERHRHWAQMRIPRGSLSRDRGNGAVPGSVHLYFRHIPAGLRPVFSCAPESRTTKGPDKTFR